MEEAPRATWGPGFRSVVYPPDGSWAPQGGLVGAPRWSSAVVPLAFAGGYDRKFSESLGVPAVVPLAFAGGYDESMSEESEMAAVVPLAFAGHAASL